jgi:hypothetical protein
MEESPQQSRICVESVTIRYSLPPAPEGADDFQVDEQGADYPPCEARDREVYEITFDLHDGDERRIGTICFDDDARRIPELLGTRRYLVDARTGNTWVTDEKGNALDRMEERLLEPRRINDSSGHNSARSVAVHEELTCNWITIR